MRTIFLFIILLLIAIATIAQSPVTIELNGVAAVHRNEPVIINVSLSNQQAQYAQRWNTVANNKLNSISDRLKQGKMQQHQYDKEKKSIEENRKKVSSITIGTNNLPWTSLLEWQFTVNGRKVTVPLKLLPNPGTDNIAVLDENGFYMASFGISPAEIQNLAPGIYLITAKIGDAISESYSLEIRSAVIPPGLTTRDSLLLNLAMYHWYNNEPAKGLEVVEKVLASDPKSISAFSIRGDLLLLQKNYNAALESYNIALELYYKKYPNADVPPEYLLDSIAYVKGELSKK